MSSFLFFLFSFFFTFLCLMLTHTDTAAQHRPPLLPLYCVSWSLSLRAVCRAWGQWEQAGSCVCQGTSFRGPAVAGLGFHVCLQTHISRVVSLCALSLCTSPGWRSVLALICFPFPPWRVFQRLEMQKWHRTEVIPFRFVVMGSEGLWILDTAWYSIYFRYTAEDN